MKGLKPKKHSSGFSLVELMIAVTLGLLITAAVLQTFVSLKRTYTFTEEFSRVQENGRFAIEFLAKDIRGAGNFGCLSSRFDDSLVENDLNDQSNIAWDLSDPVLGYDNVVNGTFTLYGDVKSGTDVLVLKSLSNNSVPLVSPYTNGNQMFADDAFNDDCSGSTDCHEGEILMVTDCSKATIFQATSVTEPSGASSDQVNITSSSTGDPGNIPGVFINQYDEGSFLAKFGSVAYFIRDDALYRSRLNSSAGSSTAALVEEELLEGVEDMQILYGEDTSGDDVADYYVPADHVTDMDDVVSIQVNLMMVSLVDNLADTAASNVLPGSGITSSTDRKIRKEFTTKVAIRNRLN